jgi:short-subunit dehydrogenase
VIEPRFRSVVITGASSGLGRALAERLSAPGVRIALGGRDAVRLKESATVCRLRGAEAVDSVVDVTDAAATAGWVQAADDARSVDLVIACAGISGESAIPGDNPTLSRQIHLTNVIGALNTVEPLLPAMRARRRGHVALVASAAGYRGFARAASYSASKAAMIVQCEGWREALAPFGIGVTCICPGYVRTPMTARHTFTMPFLLDTAEAADRSVRAIERNAACAVFPLPIAMAAWLGRTLPRSWTRPFLPGVD